MEISGKSGYSDPEIYFHLLLSKISQMAGDLEGAVREMAQVNHLAGIIPPVMIRENVLAQQVRVDLASGRLEAAQQRLGAEGFHFAQAFSFPALAPGAPVTHEAGLVYNSAFRVLLYQAKREPDEARLRAGLELAERVLQGELRCQHLPIVLETLLLLGQMHTVLGERQQSLAAITRALELAEPEGFISPFVEEGQPLADLLTGLLASGLPEQVRPAYLEQLLAAFPDAPGSPAKPSSLPAAVPQAGTAQALVEALSARELEVLQRIAQGDSNQAIADKLFITVSAVKKHTGNIYGKLSVNSRTQAVSRARQLGLLNPDP
jgi:LuxR family maltose regulon positive regulatory protein